MKIIDELHSKGFDRASAPSMTILSRNEENGEKSSMVFHPIMPGVYFVYNNFHSQEAVEADYNEDTKKMIEINHCRRGRFGCKVNGRQVYLGKSGRRHPGKSGISAGLLCRCGNPDRS